MYPQQRRRKKHPPHVLRTVEFARGKNGYGFTISGQQPCVLSCVVSGSPADRTGLKTGDLLISVNEQNVSNAYHDDVVRLIGSSRGVITLQIAENFNSSDSSDEEFLSKPVKAKFHHHHHHHQHRRYKKSYDDMNVGAGDRHRVNKYTRNRHEPQGRARSQSPGRFLDEHPAERYQPQPRLKDIENVNPMIGHHSRSRHKHAGSKTTKHTIITREHRLGLPKSQSNPDGFGGRPAPRHVRDLSSSSSSSTNTFLPGPGYPHGGVLGQRGGDARQQADDLMEEEAEDRLLDEDMQVVVGYVGSIELPQDDKSSNSRLHALRNAVRRLRVERRVHTHILMQVSKVGVQLVNTMGNMVACYPAEKVCYSGVCPEDERRYFGIATLHGSVEEEEQNLGSAYHVFMVNPDLAFHVAHLKEAQSFGIKCVNIPGTERCQQFPSTAKLVVCCISRLHQDGTTPNQSVTNGAFAQPLMPANPPPQNESSNSDSGLGVAAKEDGNNARVCVVEMPTPDSSALSNITNVTNPNQTFTFSDSTNSFSWHGDLGHSSHMDSVNLDASVYIPSEQAKPPSIERLNLRAMPDPHGFVISPSAKSQNTADYIRKTVQRVMQSQTQQQQKRNAESSSESVKSNESSPKNVTDDYKAIVEDVNLSSPIPPLPPRLSKQSTATNLGGRADLGTFTGPPSPSKQGASIGGKKTGATPVPVSIPQVPDLPTTAAKPPLPSSKPPLPERRPVSSRLSRTPIRPPTERPKSTPPIRGFDPDMAIQEEDYDSDPGNLSSFVHTLDESWSGKIPETKDTPQKIAVVATTTEVRRHSEGFVLSNNQKEEIPPGKITKSGSFKHFKQRRPPGVSNSHESLVVSDADFPQSSKSSSAAGSRGLVGAPSVSALHHHGDQDNVSTSSSIGIVGRAASWAVSFNKLLNDKVGLATFSEFLKKEFSEENIIFYCKVEKYRNIADDNERRDQATCLYNEHLAVSASEAVNVDSASKSAAEAALSTGATHIFDQAQKHIFTLMKHDSYARFLKSPLYKASVLAEMEGRPLPFSEDTVSIASSTDSTKGLKKQPSTSSTEEGGEKRRRSLLPWNRNKSEKRLTKVSTDTDLRKNGTIKRDDRMNNNGRPSLDLADLKQMTKEITSTEEPVTDPVQLKENQKFCRVLLPDGSTTVIYATAGEPIRGALSKLCERRNLTLTSLDIYVVGQEKPIESSCDISVVGSKEIKLERRIVFRLDLPAVKKSIGVKGQPQKTAGEMVKSAAARMGMKMQDNMVLYVHGSNTVIDQESNVITLENKRVVLQNSEDFSGSKKRKEWGGVPARSRPPLPPTRPRTSDSKHPSSDTTLDAMFTALFEGNATFNGLFDEHGILDPDNKKLHEPRSDVLRSASSSSFFGRRRNSYSEKSGPATSTTSSAQQQQQNGKGRGRLDAEDEKVFELLSRVGRQLDDQRGQLRPQDLQLPDFLVLPANSGKPQADKKQISAANQKQQAQVVTAGDHRRDVVRRDDGLGGRPVHNGDSSLYENGASEQTSQNVKPGRESCVSARSLQISPSKIPFADQSFGEGGVVPSHGDAEDYFSVTRSLDENVNYDDSKLMERTLRDIGLESKPMSNSPKNGVFLSGVRLNTPISELRQRLTPRKNGEAMGSPRRSQPMMATAPVPKPRGPKRRKAPAPPSPFSSSLPHGYVAQEGDVEITLLPPSSTDSEESTAPSIQPSNNGTLSRTRVADFSPPPPISNGAPVPPVRQKNRNTPIVPSPRKQNKRPIAFAQKFDSSSRSETSTPSPTTHDLIFDAPGYSVKEILSPQQRNGDPGPKRSGRVRRVLAVEVDANNDEEDSDDVQVSYV